MNNQKGFSLIELMVVVAIIGILSAVAVPNFQKFQAKSRQSEAKANLGGLYSAQKAFYAEWNMFFTDFRDIGFAPEGQLKYRVGFLAAGQAIPAGAAYTGPSGANPAVAKTATVFSSANAGGYCTMPLTAASVCRETNTVQPLVGTSCTGTAAAGCQAFVAGTAGNIDSDATVDYWTINQAKQLVNTGSDLVD